VARHHLAALLAVGVAVAGWAVVFGGLLADLPRQPRTLLSLLAHGAGIVGPFAALACLYRA